MWIVPMRCLFDDLAAKKADGTSVAKLPLTANKRHIPKISLDLPTKFGND